MNLNNFNLVLGTIKQHCKEVNVPNRDCLDIVKEQMRSKDEEGVDFYLDFLQDLGLIQYSGTNGYIALTERGKYTDQLFK